MLLNSDFLYSLASQTNAFVLAECFVIIQHVTYTHGHIKLPLSPTEYMWVEHAGPLRLNVWTLSSLTATHYQYWCSLGSPGMWPSIHTCPSPISILQFRKLTLDTTSATRRRIYGCGHSLPLIFMF